MKQARIGTFASLVVTAVLVANGVSGVALAGQQPSSTPPAGPAVHTGPGLRAVEVDPRTDGVASDQTFEELVADLTNRQPDAVRRHAMRPQGPTAAVAPPQAGVLAGPFVNDGGYYDYYDLDRCRDEFPDIGARYKNHFASCQVSRATIVFADCSSSGCLPPKGYLDYRFTQIGFGARGTQNVKFIGQLDDFKPRGTVDWWRTFTIRFTCTNYQDADDCASTNPDPQTRTLAEWRVNGALPELVLNTSASAGGGDILHDDRDRVNYHQLHTFHWLEGDRFTEYTPTDFRCDAAPYASNGGCIFHRVQAVKQLSLREEDGIAEEAAHVLRAQKDPSNTKPGGNGIEIPGGHDSNKQLTRLYPGYEPEYYDANHNIAVANCRKWWGRDYTTGPNGEKLECDEYPFRSTFEGAEFTDVFPNSKWKYSSEPIGWQANNKAGRELGEWYTLDHNIQGDQYWVEVVGCDGCGGSGGPRPPWDQPPIVNAGPDTTAVEGTAASLTGSATDDLTTPTVAWSFRPGANVDPGATCTFANPNAAVTTFTCTDDGTFTVTLSASDGAYAPVSDDAIVTVTNAAPVVKIDSPRPGQLFNGREPTPVSVSFTDSGSNDTHTCSVTFGDGSQPVRGRIVEQAGTGTCTASHTYGYDGLGPRTIRATVDDDDGGTASDTVRVVIFVPGSGFAASAKGLIGLPRTPDVHCPPSDSRSIVDLGIGLGSVDGLHVDCSLDTTEGRTVVDTSVSDVNLLAGAVRITGIESHCTAGADGIRRTSRVGTINGTPIGTGQGSLTIVGVATIRYNETSTNDKGQLVQNAIRITTPVQEILIANCTLG